MVLDDETVRSYIYRRGRISRSSNDGGTSSGDDTKVEVIERSKLLEYCLHDDLSFQCFMNMYDEFMESCNTADINWVVASEVMAVAGEAYGMKVDAYAEETDNVHRHFENRVGEPEEVKRSKKVTIAETKRIPKRKVQIDDTTDLMDTCDSEDDDIRNVMLTLEPPEEEIKIKEAKGRCQAWSNISLFEPVPAHPKEEMQIFGFHAKKSLLETCGDDLKIFQTEEDEKEAIAFDMRTEIGLGVSESPSRPLSATGEINEPPEGTDVGPASPLMDEVHGQHGTEVVSGPMGDGLDIKTEDEDGDEKTPNKRARMDDLVEIEDILSSKVPIKKRRVSEESSDDDKAAFERRERYLRRRLLRMGIDVVPAAVAKKSKYKDYYPLATLREAQIYMARMRRKCGHYVDPNFDLTIKYMEEYDRLISEREGLVNYTRRKLTKSDSLFHARYYEAICCVIMIDEGDLQGFDVVCKKHSRLNSRKDEIFGCGVETRKSARHSSSSSFKSEDDNNMEVDVHSDNMEVDVHGADDPHAGSETSGIDDRTSVTDLVLWPDEGLVVDRERIEQFQKVISADREKSKDRLDFNIMQYKREFIFKLSKNGENPLGTVMTWKVIVRGLVFEDAVRYFISMLFLVNSRNIDITRTGPPLVNNEIDVTLLSTTIVEELSNV